MPILLLLLMLTLLPAGAQVRGLVEVHQTQALQSTTLNANTGWHTLYSKKLRPQRGDVLLLTAQAQLTLDSTTTIGQQFRLTVNGRPVGTQAIEFNERTGSHHLPMWTTALVVASDNQEIQVKAEASTFHSDGNFPVIVDYSDNLKYGGLSIQQYRNYSSKEQAQDDSAKFLQQARLASAPTQERVCVTPYQQEAIGEIRMHPAHHDIVWLSAQTVGVARWGFEMLAGVLTANAKAVSPYGGQNVAQENLFAPLQLQGYTLADGEPMKLEWRVYGGFSRGLVLYPGATRFEALRFGDYGRSLHAFGQRAIQNSRIPSNEGFRELIGRDIELRAGDVLRLSGLAQFGKPEFNQPIKLECRAKVALSGPDGEQVSLSQKNITATRSAVGVGSFLTATIRKTGTYRMSLQAAGHTDVGAVRMVLDGEHSQLQFLHFR